MLGQGIILMLAGMGTGFMFLIVMICTIVVSSGIVRSIEAKLQSNKSLPDDSDEMARIAASIAIGHSILKS